MVLLDRCLADLIVVVHAGYVAFVLIGQLLILVGLLRRWTGIRNLPFRLIHLTAILVVVLEAWFGITCPLTTWERSLREAAGDTAYEGDFIANAVHAILFYRAPPWVFTLCYSAFAGLVLLSFLLAPPRRKSRLSRAG